MIKRFLSYSKITSANLCKPIHDISGMERGKLPKFKYLENGKSFLDEKAFLIVFEGLSFDEKIKNSGHKL